MLNTTLKAFVWMVVLLLSTPVFSSSSAEGEPVDVTGMIMHHIKDAHEWHILSYPNENGVKQHVSVPLPIILIDGGVKVFSSKRFYHEDAPIEIVTPEGNKDHYYANPELGYGIFHETIYKLNDSGQLDFNAEGYPTNAKPYDFSITKHVFTLIFSSILLFILLKAAVKSYKNDGLHPPRGIARFVEPIVVFVRDDIAKENIGEAKYKKYMPYLLTAFFFIWINNMLGLIPIFPGGANLTGDISFTLTLAAITMLVTVFSGNKHYWGHIFATPGVPFWLLPIMIPVEIVGIFAKPFALMVRLFANITAGHIIILSLTGIIFTFGSAAWAGLSIPMSLFLLVLKLLVAFLQAFIFTMLSALFIGGAVAEEH
ncbi:F0F1 ATP synthase subunit A [Brumimicrobium oceani]|uniref:ATP synthase subunit a n=1 Tax=Brumimicrobium oceani TaxID=2100725 RepID=A0A2U2XCN7_9FLAO|nr:F0F1 ATP synthase subunit A [Brumimicrobium oceani]PWH85533.1 ATP synthase F0 subunit A [Brumimicrobium oceani]